MSASYPSDFNACNRSGSHHWHKMSGTPLTKPLNNGRVQTRTGVSCMESRCGSTGFAAVRSLSWPPGYAVGVDTAVALIDGVSWVLSQPPHIRIQSRNPRSIRPRLSDDAGLLVISRASLNVGRYQLRNLMNPFTALAVKAGTNLIYCRAGPRAVPWCSPTNGRQQVRANVLALMLISTDRL